ncbi:hypothetical protein, partial [Pseudomonas sp. HY7a-MNA-CIBAN-0227]|uniref:hypothetical protein n=1 Tax=Pseudomonas sp. HY7a-MNA-CIBAN-0227 TaxID=3140474 RepID=UPI0033248A50
KQMGFCFGRWKSMSERLPVAFNAKVHPSVEYPHAQNEEKCMNRNSNIDTQARIRLGGLPLGKAMQSVSAFLVWCSRFSQGRIFQT